MTTAAQPLQARRFSVAHLAMLAPWVALVIGSWGVIGDNSFLWHVRAGSLQRSAGEVLTTDPFSFTMNGAPWRTQSWLIELLYDWSEGIAGLSFVPIMILLVGTITFVTIALLAYRRSRSVAATAFVLVLTTIILVSFLVPRPVLFSFALMSLVMLAWDRPQTRWAVPFLFWLWASIHASFLIGLAYIGLTLIMEREWRELLKAVVSGLVTLLTAHGLGVVTFLLDFTQGREALTHLTEWRRPDFSDPFFIAYLGGILFCVIGFVRRTLPLRWLWVVLPFAVLGLTSVRAIPPAWLGLVPAVAAALQGLAIGTRAGLRPQLALIFTGFVLLLPFFLIDGSELSEARFPLDARMALDAGRTFHDDVVGGYLIWAEGPERQVYLDDRAELYRSRLEEFVQIRQGDLGWENVFERDGIEQALLKREVDENLVEELSSAGWATVHSDEYFVVLRPEEQTG